MKQTFQTLNILKGIAIIMILIVHNRHFVLHNVDGIRILINFGQMGVSIFFTVSGMALCHSWVRQVSNYSHLSFKELFYCYFQFIKKRYYRLAPGFLIVLFVNLLLNILLIDIFNYSPGFIMNRNPLGFLINIAFLHGLTPSFINTVFPSGWYIGTTFILYLLFPFIYYLFQKIYTFNKKVIITIPIIFLLINCFITIGIFYATSQTLYPYNCSFQYFFFLNHLPAFSIGILLFFIEKEHFSQKCSPIISLLLFGISLILSLYLYIKPDHYFLFMVIPTVVSIATLWLATFLLHIEKKSAFSHIQNPITDFVTSCGKYSYEMYLMHGFFSWYGIKALTTYLTQNHIHYNDILLYIILLPITVLLVYLSGRFFSKILSLFHRHR